MSKPITAFFAPAQSKKRSAEEEPPLSSGSDAAPDSASPSAKVAKTEAGSAPSSSQDPYEANRMKALARLNNKTPSPATVAAAAVSTLSVEGDAGSTTLEKRTMHPSWYNRLKGEFEKDYFKSLRSFLASERAAKVTIYPPEDQIYSWSNLCPFEEVRVVILGQDPYINPGQAHGLAFSVNPGIPPPPSLLNMYKELETDIPGFKRPTHGSLVSWSRQGVLLLNASLTVAAGKSNSHAGKGWEKLTDAAIKQVNDNLRGVVFLLWGNYAKQKGKSIDGKKHCIISCAHPSPLSAHNGFFGSKCFSRTNDYLVSAGKKPINWNSLSE